MKSLWGLIFFVACAEESHDTGFDCSPMPSWSSSAEPVLVEHCQPCHASTAPNRHGAPQGVTFDTPDEALIFASEIEEAALGPSPTMPPVMSMPDLDKTMLREWLECQGR